MALSSCLLLLVVTVAVIGPVAARFRAPSSNDATGNCVYTVYVRTGSIFKGGTDSKISVSLYDTYNNSLTIYDLEAWGGLMPVGWNYFERGNLDIFSGRAACLSSSICKVIVSSDGSGDHHGWYVNYVETSITGPHLGCAQSLFTLEQWLALDTYPYELSTVVDGCHRSSQRNIELLSSTSNA